MVMTPLISPVTRIRCFSLVVPDRTGIDEHRAARGSGSFGKKKNRVLEFDAGAPVQRTAERVARRTRCRVSRTDARGLKSRAPDSAPS